MLLNMLGTVAIVTAAAYVFFDLPLLLGAIVGILVGGTSSAVVIPIVNNLQIIDDTKTMLAVESNLNVVFSVVLAYSLWRIWQGELISYGPIISDMTSMFLLSILIGFVTAVLWSRIIPLARYLENNLFTTPAFLLIVFGTAPLLGGDGTLAVLAFGITLGNLKNLYRSDVPFLSNLGRFRITYNEELFFSSLMFVFKTFFFVYMGIMTNVMDVKLVLWGAGIIVLLYLWRWSVAHFLFFQKIPEFDLLVVKAMLPKGLVAGAVLVTLGAPQLEALAYPIIFMSIVGTSIAVFFVQHRMKALAVQGNKSDATEDVSPNIHTRLLSD
jgi:NhaP-type Na+/H+ or K+/H+ antiporter